MFFFFLFPLPVVFSLVCNQVVALRGWIQSAPLILSHLNSELENFFLVQ